MEKSFCFNSINGDRKYKAEDFREYFASFISNGIFPNPSTNLQAMGGNGNMTVTLKKGSGWINGALYVNDNDLILPIDVADGVLNRIDRIVLRMDTLDRAINAVVKKGAFASSPVAPTLQRDADAYEIGIADIYVAAGAPQITLSKITDLRLNTSLCGIVHGTVEQVDTTTLFNQYLSWLNEKKTQYNNDMANWTAQKQADFNTWYNNITSASQTEIDDMEAQFEQDWNNWFPTVQSALDGDTAGNLLNLINENTSSIADLEENFYEHKAEKATQTVLGHVKVDNDSVKIDDNGVISVQKPLDYGRYQAEFGVEDAVLTNLGFDDSKNVSLSVVKAIVQEVSNVSVSLLTNIGVGQEFSSNTLLMNKILSVELLTQLQTSAVNLRVSVYDKTTSTLLGSKTQTIGSTKTFTKFIFDTPITIDFSHIIQIRVDQNGVVTPNNSYYVYYQNTDIATNQKAIQTTNLWTTTSDLTGDLAYRINGIMETTTGTATKTYTPLDLKKWGNLKWEQSAPPNTSVACDVLGAFEYISQLSYINYDLGTNLAAGFTLNNTTNTKKLRCTFEAYKTGDPTSPLEVHIYSATVGGLPNTSLGYASTSAESVTTSRKEYTVDISLNSDLVVGNKYFLVFKSTEPSNSYLLSGNIEGSNNETYVNTTGTWTKHADKKIYFELFSGEIKSNIQSLQDLSDIDITQYPSLKVRWKLSRDSLENESPTISDVSATWEGDGTVIKDQSTTAKYKLVVINGQPFLEVVSLN